MPASIYSDNVRRHKNPPRPPEEPALLSDKNLAFLDSLKTAYPNFVFRPGRKFLFRPPKFIYYLEADDNFRFLLLHELAHALLGHFSYQKSLERLQIERDAWERLVSFAKSTPSPLTKTSLSSSSTPTATGSIKKLSARLAVKPASKSPQRVSFVLFVKRLINAKPKSSSFYKTAQRTI